MPFNEQIIQGSKNEMDESMEKERERKRTGSRRKLNWTGVKKRIHYKIVSPALHHPSNLSTLTHLPARLFTIQATRSTRSSSQQETRDKRETDRQRQTDRDREVARL